MKARRFAAGAVSLLAGALVLSACTGGGGDGDAGDGSVSMTLWQNSTTGPGQAFWQNAIDTFMEENPNVTIEMQSVQNEDMDGLLQTALNAGDPPDITGWLSVWPTLAKNSPAIRLETEPSIRWPTPPTMPPTTASAS